MTRALLNAALIGCVMALALWAYREDDRTRLAIRELERVERGIERQREALAVLDAEWAYLNRPERLRDLVRLNDDQLRLAPLTAEAFGRPEQVPTRSAPADQGYEVTDTPAPLGRLADAGGPRP